jgi:DNA-binding protein WhiA
VNLSEDARSELAAIEPRKPCCRLAELSALVRAAGSVHLRGGGRVTLHLEVGSGAVARRAVGLLRGYGVACEIRTFRRQAFERATRFQIHLEDDARSAQALNEAGILGTRLQPLERPPARVAGRACCRAAYLRGVFLAAGSVSGPRSPHLEFRTGSPEGAELLAEIAAAQGFRLGVAARRGHSLAYVKSAETIAELLAFMGAQEAALELEEASVVAATRGRANRLANADHANLARASRAADAQLRAIERLEARGVLEGLDPELREVARLRRRHPTEPLARLGARCRPPATKTAVHRRLAKLRRLAET